MNLVTHWQSIGELLEFAQEIPIHYWESADWSATDIPNDENETTELYLLGFQAEGRGSFAAEA